MHQWMFLKRGAAGTSKTTKALSNELRFVLSICILLGHCEYLMACNRKRQRQEARMVPQNFHLLYPGARQESRLCLPDCVGSFIAFYRTTNFHISKEKSSALTCSFSW